MDDEVGEESNKATICDHTGERGDFRVEFGGFGGAARQNLVNVGVGHGRALRTKNRVGAKTKRLHQLLGGKRKKKRRQRNEALHLQQLRQNNS